MRNAIALIATAVVLTMCGPNAPPKVEAHPIGNVCQYQTVDAAGQAIIASDYCHHLRVGVESQPYIGRPGLMWRFGGGWGRHNWMTRRAPGIGINLGGGVGITLGGGGGGHRHWRH